jgi:hypothetical protein
MKMAETKKTALQKIRDQYESISKEDLTAEAYNKCQAKLEKLYETNIKAMKDLETKSKEVASLEKKIASFEKREKDIVADYLTGFTELKAMIQSESNREALKKKALAAIADVKGAAAGVGRKTWNAFSMAQELTESDHDDKGYVTFKDLKQRFNAPSVDVLTKRLKIKADELFKQLQKDGTLVAAKVDKDFKVIKKEGEKAYNYMFDKTKIIDRLQQTDEYKEAASKVGQ